jgi:hypothetical protein
MWTTGTQLQWIFLCICICIHSILIYHLNYYKWSCSGVSRCTINFCRWCKNCLPIYTSTECIRVPASVLLCQPRLFAFVFINLCYYGKGKWYLTILISVSFLKWKIENLFWVWKPFVNFVCNPLNSVRILVANHRKHQLKHKKKMC